MNQLVKNTTIYAIGDIAPRLLSFISFPILTQYLVPAEYGIINYVNTTNTFLTIIGFLCLNTYYLVFYNRQKDVVEQKKLLGNLFLFVIGINIIGTMLLFVIGPYIMESFDSNVAFYPYMAIGVVSNLFNILSVLPLALFRMQEKPWPVTIINVVKGLLGFILTLLVVVKYNYQAEGVLFVNMTLSILFGFVFIYILWQNMIININWKQIREALVFSLPLVPGALSYFAVSMSDRMLIDKYLTLNDLGIYSTASTIALLLNILANGAYKAFEPYFFKIYGTPNFKVDFKKVHDGYFFVLICGALGLSLFSKEFFEIFTSASFHQAYYFVPLVLIGVVCSSMNLLFGTIITARGKTRINSLISITGGFISIVLNVYFLPRIGLIGACVSSAVAMGVMLIMSIYNAHIDIEYGESLFVIFIAVFSIYSLVYVLKLSFITTILIKVLAYLSIVIILMFMYNFNGKLRRLVQ